MCTHTNITSETGATVNKKKNITKEEEEEVKKYRKNERDFCRLSISVR